jgi:hypothetical protein
MTVQIIPANEFGRALKRGLGRAALYIQAHGVTAVRDILLESCLKDPNYDPQCEDSRAPWFFGMFKASAEYEWFSSSILRALSNETESYDLEQLCELAALMGKSGDQRAAVALRARVLNQPFSFSGEQHGCHALIVLDGLAAVEELARRYGKLLLDQPDEGWRINLSSLTDETDCALQAEPRLRELAQTDAAIKAFLNNDPVPRAHEETSEEARQEAVRDRTRLELPLEKILSDAAIGVGKYPSQYMRFGRHATREELQLVLARLAVEEDVKARVRLLWVFRRAPLPELHPRVWELAHAADHETQEAAMEALAQHRDSRIGNLARAKLVSTDFSPRNAEVLDLLINNYEAGDEVVLMSALRRLPPGDDFEVHSLCFSILAICKNNGGAPALDMLRWCYEATPCTLCRCKAVAAMIARDSLPPDIAQECHYDANEETRRLASSVSTRAGRPG